MKSLPSDYEGNLDFVNQRAMDNNGILNTPLSVAGNYGFLEVVKLLVRVGKAKPDIKNSRGYTATFRAVEASELEVLKILIEEGGSDIDIGNGSQNRTAIMETIYWPPNVEVLKFLVPYSKNIDVKDSRGYTALYIATEGGNIEIIRTLLQVGGANINVRNASGRWTALMRACELGDLGVVRVLV